MNVQVNRDTGSDQVDTFRDDMEETLSRDEVPLEILSPKQAEAMRRLGDIVSLPANWDSYGSSPPSRIAIETVVDLLPRIDDRNLPSVRIVPVSGGGVQLEWRASNRELQLEISADGTAQYLQIEDGRPTMEDEVSPAAEQIKFLLLWLLPWVPQRRAA